MAADYKNTDSLPVLCRLDNWTPDIDQKKAPADYPEMFTAGAPDPLNRIKPVFGAELVIYTPFLGQSF